MARQITVEIARQRKSFHLPIVVALYYLYTFCLTFLITYIYVIDVMNNSANVKFQ